MEGNSRLADSRPGWRRGHDGSLAPARSSPRTGPAGMPAFRPSARRIARPCRRSCASTSDNEHPILIEATCNQVNQDGGYTGMTPADFRDFVHALADEAGIDRRRIVLGGDHLGPNPWKALSARDAMAKARDLVRAYVEAGFTKIHLDASMACADDGELAEEEIAERAGVAGRGGRGACRRGGAPLCHRHRSAEAGRRDRSARRACRHRARRGASNLRAAPFGIPGPRAVAGAVARDRHRRPARRRFRQQPDFCLRQAEGRDAQRGGGRHPRRGVRGALDRLPDASARCTIWSPRTLRS